MLNLSSSIVDQRGVLHVAYGSWEFPSPIWNLRDKGRTENNNDAGNNHHSKGSRSYGGDPLTDPPTQRLVLLVAVWQPCTAEEGWKGHHAAWRKKVPSMQEAAKPSPQPINTEYGENGTVNYPCSELNVARLMYKL
jgi:hypothetical protein